MADTLTPRALARRNDRLRALLLLGLLVIVVLAVVLVAYLRPSSTGKRMGVGDVLTLAKDKRITTATIRDQDALVVGELKPGRGLVPKGGTFSAELPEKGELTAVLTSLLAATGAHVDVDRQPGKAHARLVLQSFLPVLALADLVALVLLSSAYGARLTFPHGPGHRGRHDLPAAPAAVQPADAVDLPPDTSALDLPAVPAEAQPDDVGVPVRRTAARKAPPGKRTTTKAMPAAPAEVQPGRAAPVKRTTKAPARKAAPAEDVLPPARPTRRRTSS